MLEPCTAFAIILIACQLAFRGWASLNGWFYADDFELLSEAVGTPLTLDYLLTPHDSQLMPGGVLAIWTVERAGTFAWWAASLILVVLQAVASTACWVMLSTLFSGRPVRLLLLSLYLFSTLTLTAFMWWSAAINQLPAHTAFFLATTFLVQHLRSHSLASALLTAGAVAFGLLFYVKAILVVIPLAVLSLLMLRADSSSWKSSVAAALRVPWRIWAVLAPLGLAYSLYYATQVPSPVVADSDIDTVGLADAMLRRTLGPGLLGGPWRWDHLNPPLALTATPEWAVNLTWIVLGVTLVLSVRERRVHLWGLAVAAPYIVLAVALTATGRGAQLGGYAGLEPRYLADSVPVLVLSLGVVLCGPPRISRPRSLLPATDSDVVASPMSWRWAPVTLLVVGGTVVSNVDYVSSWTSAYPARAFVENVVAQSRSGPITVADQPVPEEVMAATSYPSNLPSHLLAPLGDSVTSVESGEDLSVLDATGIPRPAIVTPGAQSAARPRSDCGFNIGPKPQVIPLTGTPQDYFWWMQVSYLSGGDGVVKVTAGDRTSEHQVSEGIHRLFIQGEGPVDPLSVSVTNDAFGLCVDTVTIGNIEAFVSS